MVYAYDQWAQLPVKDIYDTQMMLAHVSQLKDMYEKAAQEMKDFKKEYGDFYSPIQKDMDWYRQNVTGRLQNKLNDLYNRGIDPLRSPEGRAELRMELNGIDTGAIAQLKQSAANATEFLKNQSKLQAAGLYNPLYAQYEGPSLNEYSTLGDGGQGVWNRMSPTPIQNIAEFGNPYFEGMKPNVHKESRNGVEYSVEAITMDDLRRIANSRFNDLVNTPQGQLMYKYFRDVTGDDAKARQMFNETIAAGQDRRIYSKDDYEDNYFKKADLGYKYQSLAQNQRNADRQFMLELAKSGLSFDPNTGNFIKSPSIENTYEQPIGQRQLDKQVTARADALQNHRQLFLSAIQNLQRHIDIYNEEKNASDLGYKESRKPGFFVTQSSSGIPTYVNGNTTRTKYVKNKNSEETLSKLEKNARTAQTYINFFKRVLNGGTDALIKYGYLDKNGFPTEKYTQFMVKTYLNKQRMKGLSEEQKNETINGVFNSLYSAGTLSTGDFSDWRTSQFANGPLEKLPGAGDKKLISTTTDKYRYAPIYKANELGVKQDKDSIKDKIDKWLSNNKQAWVWDTNQIQDYFLPTLGGEKYVTSGTIIIPRSDLEEFAKEYGYKVEDIVKKEGFRSHVFKNDIGNAIVQQYYEIPVMTEFANSGGFNYYRANEQINRKAFGSSQNTKDREDAQRHSVMH